LRLSLDELKEHGDRLALQDGRVHIRVAVDLLKHLQLSSLSSAK
jgi:hypothetical protein